MLRLDPPILPVVQGSQFIASLILDAGARAIDTAVLEIHAAPAFFSQMSLTPGTSIGPSDTWTFHPVSPGLWRVVVDFGTPRTGTLTIAAISCVAVGRRGGEFDITCRLLEGADEDLIHIAPQTHFVAISIASGQPGVYAISPSSAFLTVPYAGVLHAQGGLPPYQWSTVGTLPTGLTLDPAGILTGTPSVAGNISLQLQVSDSTGARAVGALPLHIGAAPLKISNTTLPAATFGFAFSTQLTARGGKHPIQWDCTGLPPGLVVNGDRIEGTLDPAATPGITTVHVIARDADTPAQIAEVSIPLAIMPAKEIASLRVPGVTAVCMAPNLLVEEYLVEINYSVTAGSHGMEAEIGAILDRMADDLFREIISTDCLDAPRLGPGRPGLPGDLSSSGSACRDRLVPLLDEYRSVHDARQGVNVGFSEIAVAIDGKPVLTFSRHGPRRKKSTLLKSGVTTASRSVKSSKLAASLEKNRTLTKRYRQLLDAEFARRKKSKTKTHKRAAKRPALNASVTDLLRFRLENLFSFLDEIDWSAGHAVNANSAIVLLTTGPHQVAVRGNAIITTAPGSLHGSSGYASISYSVRIRAKNPTSPRMQGEMLLRDGGASGFEHVEAVSIPGAGMDVAAAGTGGLFLIPSTGNPAAPFGSPRPFPSADGIRPLILNGSLRDSLGRTWLLAADRTSVYILRNIGVGGFTRHFVRLPDATGSPVEIQTIPSSAKQIQDFLVAGGASLLHLTGLQELENGTAPSIASLPVTGLPTADSIVAISTFRHDTDYVAVAWAISGRVSLMRRTSSGFQSHGFHPAFATYRPLLGLSGVKAINHWLVVASRQEQALHDAPFAEVVAPTAASAPTRPLLPLGPNLLSPAFNGWLAATVGLRCQMLLLRADGMQIFMLSPTGATSLHGAENLLAIGKFAAGEVEIWSSLGTDTAV